MLQLTKMHSETVTMRTSTVTQTFNVLMQDVYITSKARKWKKIPTKNPRGPASTPTCLLVRCFLISVLQFWTCFVEKIEDTKFMILEKWLLKLLPHYSGFIISPQYQQCTVTVAFPFFPEEKIKKEKKGKSLLLTILTFK